MNELRSARWVVPVAVWLLLVLQLVVLYVPSAPGPSAPIPHADKIVHVLAFAAPVLAAGLTRRRWWPLVAVAGVLHAPVSEVVQHLCLSGRSGDPRDVVADLVGVAGASVAISLWFRRPRRRRL
ncbi:VanZ family protein [Janibacter cremeus]|uniref:VanZ family protein n=1 Tax=Janibacter cremeus TaxID=1285192 RepID=A0A852W0G6_9MICO|nr:VanZ family protein [Janibacter cremeus]NYF99171.1 VanZ family protein [Janibacter cremeus]